MKRTLLYLLTALTLGGATACTALVNSSQNSTVSTPTTNHTNLISLFLVKRDNTSNQYRGEIFPIALYINDRYVDASTDVTQDVQVGFETDRLIQLREPRSLLSAIQSFTVISQGSEIGQFAVEQLGVSQFSCSSMLVGKGEFAGEALQTLYVSLPEEQTTGFSGFIAGQEYDESWRSIVAIHQYTPVNSPTNININESQIETDLLNSANLLLAESNREISPLSELVLERTSVYDLNGDGKAEVFGTVRQGRDPQQLTAEETGQPGEPIVYTNIWLSYQNEEPIVINSQITPYEYPVTRTPYDVIGAVDITGDGIQEVIIQINDYESTSFGIYEFNGTELQQIFIGANYGC